MSFQHASLRHTASTGQPSQSKKKVIEAHMEKNDASFARKTIT